MKKLKKLLAFCMFSCMMFAVSACSAVDSALSQVNGILHNMLNKHEYATEWSKDETSHWLACTSEGCQSVSQKADHTYGEGEVIEEATEEKDGVMSYECTVCGYEKTEKIAKPAPPAHVHTITKVEEVAASCTKPGLEAHYTCSGCNKLFEDEEGLVEIDEPKLIAQKSHTEVIDAAVEATCEAAGKTEGKHCFECGTVLVAQKIVPAKGHAWDEGELIRAATCMQAGVKTYTCANDSAHTKTETIAIDENAHAWNEGVVTTAATCSAEGVKTFTCAHNNKHTYTETIAVDENAHAWNEGVVTTAATCSAEGEKTFTCKHNGEHTKKETVEIDENAHAWNEGVVTTNPTCSAEGEKTFTCKHNGEHTKKEAVEINKDAHDWNEGVVTTAATCLETGVKTFTCKHNGEHTYTETLDALGHDIVIDKAVDPTCTETGLTAGQHCTRCNDATVEQTLVPAAGHKYDDNNDADCNVCGEVRDVSCQHAETEVIKGVAATCTTSGLTDGLKCSACGEIVKAQEVINASGHTEVVDPAVAAKCEETGLTEGSHCSVCEEVLVAQKVVPATGHTEVVDEAVAPTCTATGLTEGSHCSVCNKTLVAQEVVEMLDHEWGDGVATENGISYTCINCGEVEEVEGVVPTEKHVCDHLVSGVETEFASWTACSVCGAKSYAVTALSAYSGSGVKHASVDVYLPKEGGKPTVSGDMVKQSVKVSDVAVSFNLVAGADNSKSYVEFAYTITASEAMTVNVFVNGRSTNTSNNINAEVQLKKFVKLYQGTTEVAVSDSAVFPAYVEDRNYWVEAEIATIQLSAGENKIAFRFTKEITFNTSKAYGGYISYFRFAESSKLVEGCEQGVHDLVKVAQVDANCFDGMKAHYVCAECDKVFDLTSKLETEAKYLVIPAIYTHVYENVTRLQEDGTYAYVCTRGCGTVKEHTCTGEGNYLFIAREPNKVWYEEGQTFDPSRMEVYLSTACAEGCTGNTAVAGHLHGYDALTYTYQNGEAFKAGDTYITINYAVEGETYSVQLPVTVTAVGGTLTVDNEDEGFSYVEDAADVNNKTIDPARKNDTGKVGQSAYGGSYANNFADGDTATFTFTLEEAQENANIVLRACSDRTQKAGGTPPCVYAVSVNDLITIKVDGVEVVFDDDVIFKGSVTNLDQTDNRWVWTNWMNLDLGTYNLGVGEHTVEITFNNVLGVEICASDTPEAAVQLDCLNVFFG